MRKRVGMEAKRYHIIQTNLENEIAHGVQVSNLAYRIGKQLELPEEICHELAVAGLMHDIGKLEMIKYIYGKEADSTLHVEEMRYVRTHPALGYVILNEQGYSRNVAQWVLYHHENYDGSGYPSNKMGDEIPLGARILRVSDVFTALTADRSYRKAFDTQAAVELMIDEIKNFDMKVFLAFMNVIHADDPEPGAAEPNGAVMNAAAANIAEADAAGPSAAGADVAGKNAAGPDAAGPDDGQKRTNREEDE